MRYAQLLKLRYQTIFAYTGLIFIFSSSVLLTPLFSLLKSPHDIGLAYGFVVPALISGVFGFIVWKAFKPRTYAILSVHEAGIIVLVTWIGISVISAFPFMLITRLNFTQAVFESVSGWTTTGLSVVNVTEAPDCILLFRSIIQFLGGAGFAIIMLASIAGPAGPGHSIAEGKSDQLVPHVRESARLVMMIYSGYAVAGTIAYIVAGMMPFDAVNHSFAAISTGGFSTKPASIGAWDSVDIEIVSIILMIAGNLNFLTAYLLLSGKFRAFLRNGEVHVLAFLIPIGSLVLFYKVAGPLYSSLDKALRVAVFESVTALTTTGFSTVAYSDWNALGFIVLILFMLIGGGACSTAGGIKQYRVHLMAKALLWEIKSFFQPRTAVREPFIWQGEVKEFIKDSKIREVSVFIFLYLVTFILGTAVIACYGYSLRDSLFEFASSLGTVGLSVGVTAPGAPKMVLWVETIGMLLGRLEFYVILIGFGKLVKDGFAIIKG